jgi:hypothetical protein
MPQSFEFSFERLPIAPIRFLFGRLLPEQGRFEHRFISRESKPQEGTPGGNLPAELRPQLSELEQERGGAKFVKPKSKISRLRTVNSLKIVRFDQSLDHRPVFLRVRFLCLHQICQTHDFRNDSFCQFDCRPPPPESAKIVHASHTCHNIDPQIRTVWMPAAK